MRQLGANKWLSGLFCTDSVRFTARLTPLNPGRGGFFLCLCVNFHYNASLMIPSSCERVCVRRGSVSVKWEWKYLFSIPSFYSSLEPKMTEQGKNSLCTVIAIETKGENVVVYHPTPYLKIQLFFFLSSYGWLDRRSCPGFLLTRSTDRAQRREGKTFSLSEDRCVCHPPHWGCECGWIWPGKRAAGMEELSESTEPPTDGQQQKGQMFTELLLSSSLFSAVLQFNGTQTQTDRVLGYRCWVILSAQQTLRAN